MGNNNSIHYYGLTHPQKRVWYIDKINSNSSLHNIGGCLKINKAIDVEKMSDTLNIIIQANEGLRLRFKEINGQPFQYIQEFQKENIEFLDFSVYEDSEKEFMIWSEDLFKKKFQLEENKMYYFSIYKINEEEYGVLVNIHHIISDGWTFSLIQNYICEIYSKLKKEYTINFNDYYSSYLNYIEDENKYLNSDRFNKNKVFWHKKLKNPPKEFLYKSTNNLDGKRKTINVDSNLSKEIKRFSKEEKCSLNTFFIGILLIYMNKVIHKKDLIIGTPVFNRVGNKQKNTLGMFTSTVPFRFSIDTEAHIVDLIRLINRELKLCFLNQKYPYDLLIKDLELGKMGYDSLFKMSVNYYNSEYAIDLDGVDVAVEEYYCGNQSYSLQLTVKEWQKSNITLNFDYKIEEYLDEEIKSIYDSMINIIKQVLTSRNILIKDIKLIDEKEANDKIYNINSTKSYYPNKTVYELFEEQVIKNPDKIALEFKEEKLTYRELNERSNQLANYLKKDGESKKQVVGIMLSHSIELVIAILGVLKTGWAYLPIDPNYPVERVNYMLKDSGSDILLTDSHINNNVKFRGNAINVKELDFNIYSNENLGKQSELSNLAYIIYTSGSTGKPKGVMIEHRGLTNYIWWANKKYLKDENEVMALYSSISFDLTITSIFTPLISGNQIVIYDTDEDEFVLYKILRENKATVVKLTPSHLILLKDMDNSNSNIKRFIVGGEDLKVSLAKEISNSFRKGIEIFNEYGPTETVVGCMIYKYDEEKDKGISVPIGYSADNVQIYILDNNLNMVTTGFVGELYISGDGVVRGYLNRPELTNERFIENPFVKGKRMYKTGDMARYLEGGIIEYVGRIDNQVKIRGHRIELAEIERHLLENESVKDAVVIIKEDSLGNRLLNAYIVSKKDITYLELKRWLLKFLPKHMIPTNFVFIDKLPLTINGKINYSLLPEPIKVEKEFIKYETNLQKELIKAMEEILGVKNISMNDNYYQLGGDSIKAIQISSKLKNIGLEIKVKDILTYDSIEEIANTIEENRETKVINQGQSQGFIERTPILEWFFNEKFSNESVYNQYVALEYNEVLDVNNVKLAVNKLIEHHDGLRINYNRENNKLYYNNEHLKNNKAFKCVELLHYTDVDPCTRIKTLINQTGVRFNIENSLLFNATMFNLGNKKQVLLFQAHHLVVDGISWRIILNDFITILNQLENKEKIKLPMKTNSFKEWAEKLQEYGKKDSNQEKAYWKSILNKKFTYPLDFNNKGIAKTSSILSCELDENITSSLMKKVNEIYSIDFNEVLVIALAITINKLTNNEDVVIELERHGRENIDDSIDVSRTIGWFTSMYPAYFKVESNEIDANIKAMKEQLRNIPNQGFNYGILKFLNKELEEIDNKYIRFNYLGDFDNILDKEKLDLYNIVFGLDSDEKNSLTALIDISASIVKKKLKISLAYSSSEFSNTTIQNFIDSYVEMLRIIVDRCDRKVFKEFTPSDFDAVEISQDDLDALFD